MEKIIVFCKKYNQNPQDKYLTNELVEGLIQQGNKVTVMALGDIEFHEKSNTIREYLYPIKGKGMFSKYLIAWPKATLRLFIMILKGEKFDKLIAFAPLSVIFPLIFFSKFLNVKKRICVVFDIFPIHQYQIGRFGQQATAVFKKIERNLLNSFDIVTGMTKENKKQIANYYQLKKNVQVKVLPLWGFRPLKTYNNKTHRKSINMIFGGQIVPGRSVDKLIKLIELLRRKNVPVTLTLFSKGEGFEKLKDEYKIFSDFIIFKDRIPREEYINVLATYDIGAIVTDPRVSMPTFPSKIIDYFNAGLPCFCMIEQKSDIGEVINNKELLLVNHFDFSDLKINEAINFILNVKEKTENYDFSVANIFSVKNATSIILEKQ